MSKDTGPGGTGGSGNNIPAGSTPSKSPFAAFKKAASTLSGSAKRQQQQEEATDRLERLLEETFLQNMTLKQNVEALSRELESKSDEITELRKKMMLAVT